MLQILEHKKLRFISFAYPLIQVLDFKNVLCKISLTEESTLPFIDFFYLNVCLYSLNLSV